MTEPLLLTRGLGRTVNRRPILDDVSLAIHPADRIAVVGPSGSGKTTLLTLLAGLIPPTTGEVVRAHSSEGGWGSVAIVLQGYGLIGVLTAAENVEIALRATGRKPRDAIRMAADVLRQLGLSKFADHLVHELSGGQRQRVAVARALALAPRVLLADEPTAEQDADHEELVLQALLPEVPDHDRAVVIATHDPGVAARCERTIELADGRVVHPVSGSAQ